MQFLVVIADIKKLEYLVSSFFGKCQHKSFNIFNRHRNPSQVQKIGFLDKAKKIYVYVPTYRVLLLFLTR